MAEPRLLRARTVRLAAALALAAAPALGLTQTVSAPAATAGADSLVGGPGADTILGQAGADTIRGLDGPDYLNGNGGDDSVGGGPGNDRVNGGQGRDQLNGGQGDDTLSGDKDDDTLTGGLGADWFVLAVNGGQDVVTDFSSAGGDRIVLPEGATPSLVDGPGGVVIRLASGEGLRLVGVTAAGLGDWRAALTTEAVLGQLSPPPVVTARATEGRPPRQGLQVVIIALAALFAGLVARGLYQLVNYTPQKRG